MAGGDLYLTSRAKDVIIRGGRNVYPYELEEAVGNLPGVRKGCVAAVGVADEASGTERLLVLVEKRDPASGNDDELRTRVQSLANELLSSPADEVVLLPPNSVLKTSSGKIRRAATRDAYLQGLLGRRGPSVRLQFARMALQSGYGSVRRGGRKVGAWLRAARGWTAFVLLAPLAWATAVLSREPARAWKRSARFARLFFRLAGISVEVSGLEHLPQHGAYVLLANHGSYLDGILLVGALERPHAFIAKKEFVAHAVSRWFLSAIGSLYVERFDTARGIEDVHRFTEHARAGSRLAIFPEGTFTRQSGLRPFLMGAFVIATDAGIPVVPTTISGAREILRDGSWFPAPGPVQIRIGEPIAPRGSGWEAAADLRSRARRAMLAQGTEPALDSAVLADKRRHAKGHV
jgi:1-acyl-sn-glycerol-3-phosphate acyltransferase